jgi:hypothetical protein
MVSQMALDETQQISLCELLDRVLNKGVVVVGEATISVADIDLVYLGLQVILTSVEKGRRSSCPVPDEERERNKGGVADGMV